MFTLVLFTVDPVCLISILTIGAFVFLYDPLFWISLLGSDQGVWNIWEKETTWPALPYDFNALQTVLHLKSVLKCRLLIL